MVLKRLKQDWSISADFEDFEPALRRFKGYMMNNGFRESTITGYMASLKRFLAYARDDKPSVDVAKSYRELMIKRHLARSTINNCSFSIKLYYKMLGIEIEFPFLERNDNLPYFFDEDDVLKVFGCCKNLKHLAMLKTLFYGCLRASELCNLVQHNISLEKETEMGSNMAPISFNQDLCYAALDLHDLDTKTQTIRIRDGKGGKDGVVYLKDECIRILKQYLAMRSELQFEDGQPLFYTVYGKRWDRKDVHRIFVQYKNKAGISKPGGVHCFGRHTPATIMIAKGADIRIVQKILRYNDIKTTLRYAHVSDKTQREAYEKFLTL